MSEEQQDTNKVNEELKNVSLNDKDDAKKTETSSNNILTPEEIERRFQLIRSVGEECVTDADLRNLLSKKESFRLYDGFEPSGRMHIAQGIFKALNVNKCTAAGGTFVFWVADWFGLMNDKMGGDIEKIKVVGQYFIEVWKGAGMDLTNVEFRWASDDIINNAKQYWEQMLDITKRFTIARIKKCCQIMGRAENSLTAAQILYPLMQCTDIFHLRADICQLGVDQRKVNMLAREYCDHINRKLKPVILSHHMLYGLAKGQAKMSKSNPDSAIFLEDPQSEVYRKMDIAYCPRIAEDAEAAVNEEESMSLIQDALKNPCLDYAQYIVMNQPNAKFVTKAKTYTSFEDIKTDFLNGTLSEAELKQGIAEAVDKLLQPVRDHFENDPHAKEILELVHQYKREPVSAPTRLKRMAKLFEPASSVVVFAPIPHSAALAVGDVLSTMVALQHAKQEASGKRVVLFIENLNAIGYDCMPADKKLSTVDGIKAFYDVFLASLKSVNALDGVEVLFQDETMYKDPSDYWLAVINVGRSFQLQSVLDAYENATQAGAVVSALMHVGNVLMLSPTKIICTSEAQKRLHELSCLYITNCSSQIDAIPVPTIVKVASVSTVTSALESVNLVDLLLFDSAADTKKKMKQAFCEPGNTAFNPVLQIARGFLFAQGKSLEIKGTGFSTFEELEQAYKDEKIHPGDLKDAVTPAVLEGYKQFASGCATVASAKATLENYIKRNSKKK